MLAAPNPLTRGPHEFLRTTAVKPDPTDFTLSALFEELRRVFARLANNKGLALEVAPCEESVHSDPSLVGQIPSNTTREGYGLGLSIVQRRRAPFMW